MKLQLSLILMVGMAAADTIDFGRQSIILTRSGQAPPGAVARPDLSPEALALLRNASYDRTWGVAAWVSSHPQIQRKLDRLVLDCRTSAPRYLSDGTVSIDYEFPLTGALLRLLMPTTGYGQLLGRVACPCCGQPWPEGKEPPRGTRLVPAEENSGYTGILIDATGLPLRPALFPRVVTEPDEEVVGPGFFDPEYAAVSGPVGWFGSRAEAFASDRLGANPLVVRAVNVTGTNACDPVISRYDAARIHASRSNLDLLAQCRVGFLTDR